MAGIKLFCAVFVACYLTAACDKGYGQQVQPPWDGISPLDPKRCRYGYTGNTCGGFADVRCVPGSTCQLLPGSDLGMCCKHKPGSCPASPKDLVTHCALGCQDERDCERGQICCPWGCTSVCRYPGKY